MQLIVVGQGVQICDSMVLRRAQKRGRCPTQCTYCAGLFSDDYEGQHWVRCVLSNGCAHTITHSHTRKLCWLWNWTICVVLMKDKQLKPY